MRTFSPRSVASVGLAWLLAGSSVPTSGYSPAPSTARTSPGDEACVVALGMPRASSP
jgi:hypothetical protein